MSLEIAVKQGEDLLEHTKRRREWCGYPDELDVPPTLRDIS